MKAISARHNPRRLNQFFGIIVVTLVGLVVYRVLTDGDVKPVIATPSAPASHAGFAPVKAEALQSLAASSLKEIAARALPAVYLMEVFDADGENIGLGTAFAITADGLLVTNLHVIRHGYKVTAKAANGGRFDVTHVLAHSADEDLALVKIEGKALPHLELQPSEPDVGTEILVVGSPLGLEGTLSNGLLSAIREEGILSKGPLYQITAPISPGSSGSPVLDPDGGVIGVATLAARNESQNLNFAVPASRVVPLVEQAKGNATSVTMADFRNHFEGLHDIRGTSLWKRLHSAIVSGNTDEAQTLVEELEKDYPENPHSRIAKGTIYLQLAMYEEAIEALREATEMEPEVAEAHAWLGSALVARFRAEEAVHHLRRALELDPDSEMAWKSLAEAQLQQGHHDHALEAARNAARINPTNQIMVTLILEKISAAETSESDLEDEEETETNTLEQPKKVTAQILYPWKINAPYDIIWIGADYNTSVAPRVKIPTGWKSESAETFGGIDRPESENRIADHKTGEFRPKAFIPKLNPFYIALPYNDLMPAGDRKPEASRVIPWYDREPPPPGESACKGRWLQIYYNNRSCFAQWQDVHPHSPNDWQYVFGSRSAESFGSGRPAIRVAPAVRDYLSLPKDGVVHWRFVDAYQVPHGPWKKYGTLSASSPMPEAERESMEEQRKYLEYLRKLRDEQYLKKPIPSRDE